MKISRALLAIAGGTSIAFTAAYSLAGEDYCTYEGPDIMTYLVADAFGTFDFDYYGQSDGVGGFAMATTSGNPGDMICQWAENGDGTKSPVIAQNIYRLCDGRFEQIGMSWLKHSFCAVSEAMCSCQGTGCSTLGIGCADTYWATLNADAEAPRSEINATTGDYIYPFFQSPCGQSSLRGKLQINEDDRDPGSNPGCHFYLEAQYVAPNSDIDDFGFDEYDFDNQYNNVSWREIRFTSTTNTQPSGSTQVMSTALDAWANEEGATIVDVWTPEGDGNTGLMHVAYLVTENGDGTWHYEYVVHNQNSHRSGGSFSVPVSECVELTNVEFVDVDYHSCELVSGTDWTAERVGDQMTWYTTPYAEDEFGWAWGNSIRWATAYTFRFDANYPPSDANAVLGLWRPADAGDVIDVGIVGPIPDCTGDCPTDLDGDGSTGVNDVLLVIAGWGNPDGDVNGDGNTNVDDILLILEAFGNDC